MTDADRPLPPEAPWAAGPSARPGVAEGDVEDHWADLRDAEPAEAPVVPVDASRVAVVLVAHDGAAWLPTVLEGLAAQTVRPGRALAVDTGSTDGSGELLDAAFGHAQVLEAPATASYGEAVDLALARLADTAGTRGDGAADVEWVWLLHDDATPAPTALQRLLECATVTPEVDAVGPKLREWPSLRRLLEVGVTVSGTARRETGLERGEYDQGQYDVSHRVLAVNSAGMLVRPALLRDLGGFDPALPVLGADLDLGWRAAAAGRRIVVAPEAVVFHAEAGHRGLRRSSVAGRHAHQAERRALLRVVLANCSTRRFVPTYLRLVLGGLLRALGFLLTRRPATALDELVALAVVCGRPGELRRARAARRPQRTVPDAEVRPLLAPWWLPYRHGLDAAGEIQGALTTHAADVADRRRDARAAAERDRVAAGRSGTRAAVPGEQDDELAAESGWLVRYVTSPVALTVTAAVVLCLVGARAAVGRVSGGALAPVPDTTGAWWTLHLASHLPIGTGSEVPAPPYVAPLALLAWLLPGGPATAVSVLLVASVPFALWGAWRLLGVAGRLLDPRGTSPWLLGVGALTYALLPVTSGAWAQGRFGVVWAAALLPWCVHAALGFADPERERRWRAGWRTGLLLTLVVALVPFAWWLAAGVLLVVAVVALLLGGARALRDRAVLSGTVAPVAVAVATPLVLLAPWLVPTVLAGDLVALVGEAGRLPHGVLAPTDLLALRLDAGAAAAWPAYLLLGAALLALAVPASRIAVVGCWAVAVAVLAPAAVLALPTFDLAAGETPAAVGFVVVALGGAAVAAAVLGAQGLPASLPRASGGVRRVATLVPLLVLAVVPVAGLAWFVGPGSAIVDDDRDSAIPAYMAQRSEESPSYGVLVLEGTVRGGLTVEVRREDGLRLGEEEVAALTPADAAFADEVRTLVSEPTPEAVEALRAAGVAYVVQAAPGDPAIRATLDSVAGLQPASGAEGGARAWELVDPPPDDAVEPAGTDLLRGLLLVLQVVAVLVVLVMAGPSRPAGDRAREEERA
ncbi:glycosyltransferase [Nocardioides sp. ChNu-153]|uniref:glycosyltransferase n=1 Tax=Nocardioides sp. ChNu-153 TaxID=2779364 RepID=UPI00265063D6|nr:glycosyltransferase [Nocardioides sp. ChNu-153]MDN7120826.1 glycosyltransferase [Nocardioides sp. ChNu-153]